jgi:hypothetical protein
MSWPLKLRALSFAIGIGVVMGEVALVAIPVGIVLWAAGVAGAARIVQVEVAIALAVALVVIVPVHVRPTGTEPIARNGESG